MSTVADDCVCSFFTGVHHWTVLAGICHSVHIVPCWLILCQHQCCACTVRHWRVFDRWSNQLHRVPRGVVLQQSDRYPGAMLCWLLQSGLSGTVPLRFVIS